MFIVYFVYNLPIILVRVEATSVNNRKNHCLRLFFARLFGFVLFLFLSLAISLFDYEVHPLSTRNTF